MHKLTFTLKQHTPLIHFHSEVDASLRATELKPKLDNFLHANTEVEKKWKINGQDIALDYKLKISSYEVQLKPIKKGDQVPCFFGNMGADYDSSPKYLSMTKVPVTLQFSSFNHELLITIKKHFPDFIARTNFGTRQSKGYGSYYLEQPSDDRPFREVPHLIIDKREIRDFIDVTNIINYYYQRLKSGINYRHEYQHAFLKMYLEDKGYRWEKRWLKEKFVGGLETSDDEERFARAMLGLGGSFSFKPKNRDRRPGQVYPRQNVDVTVESTHEEIARFKSPITFKPIAYKTHWKIYIFSESVSDEIKNRRFKFSDGHGNAHYLNTPSETLDIDDLIAAYHNHLGSTFKASIYTGQPSYQVKIIKS
ncbi:MAG: hypothetical protein AAF149_23090 [Bacteroidota bacterium]